ncbi:MAG: hypothetical protein ACHQ9S_19375 [Candidatus Binatia bacterium]
MRKVPTYSASKFPLGRVVATTGAYDALTPLDIKRGIFFHSQGDWGDVCEEDKRLNDRALIEGTRILSAYVAENGTRFWIITEADRSATTVLLPEEY